jgi:hypothetical protein
MGPGWECGCSQLGRTHDKPSGKEIPGQTEGNHQKQTKEGIHGARIYAWCMQVTMDKKFNLEDT